MVGCPSCGGHERTLIGEGFWACESTIYIHVVDAYQPGLEGVSGYTTQQVRCEKRYRDEQVERVTDPA